MAEASVSGSELEQVLAEVRAARADDRLNTHFLFSALNIIARLIDAGRTADASRTVMALSRLLRHGLESQGDLIRLEEELQVVDAYAAIQRFRFGERLTLEASIPSDLMQTPIPRRLLQRLVESAFAAVESKVGQGCVGLFGRMEPSYIVLEVTHDGIVTDCDRAKVLALRDQLSDLYGPDVGLAVDDEDGNGAVIRVRLPMGSKGW